MVTWYRYSKGVFTKLRQISISDQDRWAITSQGKLHDLWEGIEGIRQSIEAQISAAELVRIQVEIMCATHPHYFNGVAMKFPPNYLARRAASTPCVTKIKSCNTTCSSKNYFKKSFPF